ncbi:DUF7284 family protein [Methanolobus psychrotolerans]|uniref:DUF7284 family protein n=1 Tax=Methanolobus psychrotolerans TaxID=1874706 RepID=UPI000B91CBC0|nr:hypothetical protein [Methanolobus psychrotolerans]
MTLNRKQGKNDNRNIVYSILRDENAFSSSIDAILFLILVSISAIILMPSIAADEQYRSASYISAQDMDARLMNTIMCSTVDEYEYTLKPTELADIDVNLSEHSILENAEKTMFTKEQHHRTFSDLVAESLVMNLFLEENNTIKVLNPMTGMQRIETEKVIEAHLEKTIGNRYNYRFEAHWEPVVGYDIQSEIIIGENAPVNAIRQKARISMPMIYPVTMEDVYLPFNESSIYNAVNSLDPDKELHEMFNNSIDIASGGSAEMVTEIVFPYEYLESLNSTEISVNSEQLACIRGPADMNYSSPVIQSALGCMNYTVNGLYGLDIKLTQEEQSISLDIVDTVKISIMNRNIEVISNHIKDNLNDDVNQTVALMRNATDNSTRYELADEQLGAIYRTANPAGADIVLLLW